MCTYMCTYFIVLAFFVCWLFSLSTCFTLFKTSMEVDLRGRDWWLQMIAYYDCIIYDCRVEICWNPEFQWPWPTLRVDSTSKLSRFERPVLVAAAAGGRPCPALREREEDTRRFGILGGWLVGKADEGRHSQRWCSMFCARRRCSIRNADAQVRCSYDKCLPTIHRNSEPLWRNLKEDSSGQ